MRPTIRKIKHLALFLFITAAFSIFACRSKDTPRSVAEKYFSALSEHDFEKASEYGTEETRNLMNMMIAFKKISADTSMADIKYEITRESVSGDDATVYYKEEGKDGELQLPMIRIDGKWKVILTKESINNTDPSLDLGATSLDTTAGK